MSIKSEKGSDIDAEISEQTTVMKMHEEIHCSATNAYSELTFKMESAEIVDHNTDNLRLSDSCTGICYPCSVCGKAFLEQKTRDTHEQ